MMEGSGTVIEVGMLDTPAAAEEPVVVVEAAPIEDKAVLPPTMAFVTAEPAAAPPRIR